MRTQAPNLSFNPSFELEPLEQRSLLAGVTVITHGQLGLIFEQEVPAWLGAMADAIEARAGGEASRVEIMVDDAGGAITGDTRLKARDPRETRTGEIIVELNWSKAANGLLVTNSTAWIAKVAVEQLLRTDWLPGFDHALAELPIHLIGHSRGGSLVAEMARLLGRAGVWVDQLTTLDPHPRTVSTLSKSDAPMGVAESVVFADNYYQRHSWTFIYGESLGAAAADTNIRSMPGGYGYSSGGDHANIHLWYHGTVDVGPSSSDGAERMTSDMRSDWYTTEELAGAATGFFFSRLAGGDRASARVSSRTSADPPIAGLHPGLGGVAERERVDWSAATWASLLSAEPDDEDRRAAIGDLLPVAWAAAAPGDAQISFTLDTDTNPFNDSLAPAGLSGLVGDAGVVRLSTASIPTAGLAPGDYHLRAAIRKSGAVRYYVDQRPLTLFATDPLKLAARRGLSASARDDGRIAVLGINGAAGPVLFQQQEGDAWLGRVLDTPADGAANGEVAAWHDPVSRQPCAAMVTPAGLIVYTRGNDGAWTELNLSTALGDRGGLTAPLTSFRTTDGIISLAALRPTGELVLFRQDGAASAPLRWTIRDLSRADLAPQGLQTPRFTGRLISYVTPWNGQNIAGLDANGDIHAVWWAPGLERWTTSNLSSLTGARPLSGGLTAYQTSWRGINLAGVDVDGRVCVTWWVPEFAARWENSNLTELFAGPTLAPDSITSYVTSWDGLNIAGRDAAGAIVIYWWAPGLAEWRIAPISEVIERAPRLDGPICGLATTDGSLNLFGRGADGDAIRYFWRPGEAWAFQDLTAAATR